MKLDKFRLLLIDACRKHGLQVIDDSWFPLSGVEAVLGEMPDHVLVFGFEVMTTDAKGWKMLRGDLIASFDGGISIPDALACITDWPRDPEYWIEAYLDESRTPNPFAQLVMDACMKQLVKFHWKPGGLLIQLSGIEAVLRDLPPGFRVLGLESRRLQGYRTYWQMGDPKADLGYGLPVEQALKAISDWPRDLELWVEIELTDPKQ